jgi:hypothetical protein
VNSYVIPYRADSQARSENLRCVLGRLSRLPGLEVVLVEQDAVSRVDSRSLPSNCVHVFAKNAGPFNKAWGVNVGYRKSSGDVIAVGDTDVIVNAQALRTCFDECGRGIAAVRPYDRWVDLTPEESRSLIDGDGEVSVARSPQSVDREGIGEFISFCSGLFVIRRDAYLQLGGFDESFIGWGGEDDAMTVKLVRFGLATRILEGETALHLWHERSHQSRYGHPHYAQNVDLLKHYAACKVEELQSLCRRGRESMGDMAKYAYP